MKALYNIETNLITRLIDTTEQNIYKYLKENEDYKNYPFSNDLSKGQNINKYTDMGTLRPNSELVAENLIILGEDQILDGKIIRDLTEEELQEKYPNRYPIEENSVKTFAQAIQEKEQEIKDLKDIYIDAELDDNSSLQDSLKIAIQTKKSELQILQNEYNEE
ncbi:MAG: hypothetical protein KFW21_05905 [Spirochaetota bacterium]|nr:hypothetical protein [Spirochaetota bacterium]